MKGSKTPKSTTITSEKVCYKTYKITTVPADGQPCPKLGNSQYTARYNEDFFIFKK